jgi:hypothetical protein
MLDFLDNQESLDEFLRKHIKPYDTVADDYDRPPFAADIKEGKNDQIYNVHSYHTKVPPRGIVPYILHYTKPGDLILDPFCGSGMTGVAAQMCVNPPLDILEQFPDLKERIGPRACILNDLSPAACHIAYNYNTPVDVDALKKEFERIKSAVKEEFDWLYGTEHYEPAIGDYALTTSEVLSRLKNPPSSTFAGGLLGETERNWTLLNRSEVEERLGYSVTALPKDKAWEDVDVSNVEKWICIPAMIQYTIWADVYRCEGFVTTEEPSGRVSKRGENAGKAIVQKKQVPRGCGGEIHLWNCAVDHSTGKVLDDFSCPKCGQVWTLNKIRLLRCDPTDTIHEFQGLVLSRGKFVPKIERRRRRVSKQDLQHIAHLTQADIPYWFPTTKLVSGEQGNPFLNRGIISVNQVYTKRNLRGLAYLYQKATTTLDLRIRTALLFAFTAILIRLSSRMTMYNFGNRGNIAIPLRLFIPHFQCETNVLRLIAGKIADLSKYFASQELRNGLVLARVGPAQELMVLPDGIIDFIFTDPPFGRNIAYSELNVFWEAWLKQTTDFPAEAITSNGRRWGLDSYTQKIQAAFSEMFRVLKPGRYAMVEFNNSDPAIFEAIKQAALTVGFELTNMMILDKAQKSFNQVKGLERGDKLVDKDVIFNLRKPVRESKAISVETDDLVIQVVRIIEIYLKRLPERIQSEPHKYSDDNRTTATFNSILLNEFMPKGVSVENLTLPAIERICSRYFIRRGNRWYLRGESFGNGKSTPHLLQADVQIKDESSALEWLGQILSQNPLFMGEVQSLWMKATGVLAADVSRRLDLEALLYENFWQDIETKKWREPTPEERDKMNDNKILHAFHDAERFLAGSLKRQTRDLERCDWIDLLFNACRAVEEQETEELPALRDFDPTAGYQMMAQLFHGVLKDHVPADIFGRAEKQARVASSRLKGAAENGKQENQGSKDKIQMEFDL